MATRYDIGAMLLNKIDEKSLDKLVNKLNRFSPDFADRLIENYGDNYSRPYLSVKEREWIAIASLVSQNLSSQMEVHVLGALKAGSTISQMIEVIIQLSYFIGFPLAKRGLLKLMDILHVESESGAKLNF